LKIAFVLGSFSVGARPLPPPEELMSSPRGLTGTEIAFVRIGQELGNRGHDVMSYVGPSEPMQEWEDCDLVLVLNEPNLLRGLRHPKRVCYQFLNDFSFVKPGFDEYVDQYIGVCDQHTAYVADHCRTRRDKWRVVPLGCDPELYEDRRTPGRVVWTSSLDRGCHHLLGMWPDIKRALPEATLRIFYHWSYDSLLPVSENYRHDDGKPVHPHILELAQRARYMKHALEALGPLDVEYMGSVSRDRMVREWNEASVFAFPCDTVAFSEGFSLSTLEAHASYTAPVITDCDCLGGIYGDSGARVVPRGDWNGFRDTVVSALRNPLAHLPRTVGFARRHTWKDTARKLEEICAT
jgi:glycosyltransferase involved in cell wall biosynthesis